MGTHWDERERYDEKYSKLFFFLMLQLTGM